MRCSRTAPPGRRESGIHLAAPRAEPDAECGRLLRRPDALLCRIRRVCASPIPDIVVLRVAGSRSGRAPRLRRTDTGDLAPAYAALRGLCRRCTPRRMDGVTAPSPRCCCDAPAAVAATTDDADKRICASVTLPSRAWRGRDDAPRRCRWNAADEPAAGTRRTDARAGWGDRSPSLSASNIMT